ncbi:MAG TPA: hypothetical protein VMN37_09700 [Gemmatimonadales bacterium]|nr:hypothetical protein [Gemmatimonadales bacterium]
MLVVPGAGMATVATHPERVLPALAAFLSGRASEEVVGFPRNP